MRNVRTYAWPEVDRRMKEMDCNGELKSQGKRETLLNTERNRTVWKCFSFLLVTVDRISVEVL